MVKAVLVISTEDFQFLQPLRHLQKNYFFLWRLALLRFLRLWVATLCLFLFLPLGIYIYFLGYLFYLHVAFDAFYKNLSGLERRYIVCRNLYSCVLADVPSGLFGPSFDNKTAKT